MEAGSSVPKRRSKVSKTAHPCRACGVVLPAYSRLYKGVCGACCSTAYEEAKEAEAAAAGASAIGASGTDHGQPAAGSGGARSAAGRKKRKRFKPLLEFSQVMLVALALHCMGVPDGWQGSPQQALALLTAFHAFLGRLPPVLEAAQQAVACQGCQLSLDVAAWQHGTRIQDVYCHSCQPEGSTLVCVGPHGGSVGALLGLTARAIRQRSLEPITTMAQLALPAGPMPGPPLVVDGAPVFTAPQAAWEGWLRGFAEFDSAYSPPTMQAFIAGLRKGAYDFATVPWRPEQAASLANPIMQLLLGLRREEDPNNAALWAASPPCTNRDSTSLLLLDFKARGWSSFHSDRTEAWNILYGVGGTVTEGAYAVWLMFSPAVAATASLLWQQMGGAPEGFNSGKGKHKKLKWDAFRQAAQDRFGSHMWVIHQRPGDVVHVPPGCVHAVLNLRECVKLAWDGFVWRHVAAYAEQAHAVGAKVTAGANAKDYMAAASVAAAALLNAEHAA